MANGNGWGGKRNGAGAKQGVPHQTKHNSLIIHAPQMIMLAQKWLYGKNVKDQQWAFDRLLPYVFRKQPQELEHSGEINHTFNRLVVEEVSSEAYVNGNGELHADD